MIQACETDRGVANEAAGHTQCKVGDARADQLSIQIDIFLDNQLQPTGVQQQGDDADHNECCQCGELLEYH